MVAQKKAGAWLDSNLPTLNAPKALAGLASIPASLKRAKMAARLHCKEKLL